MPLARFVVVLCGCTGVALAPSIDEATSDAGCIMRLRQPNEIATPVRTSRQWTTALSPNAAGDGWNYVSSAWTGGTTPIEWPVVRDFTTAPNPESTLTPTRVYPNGNFHYLNQLRAPNGRIFFPCFSNHTAYYDPTTESVQMLGPIVETPPVDPNASTNLFSAKFDTAGLLYMATQESQNRPSMVTVTNTDTLAQAILGYVGDSATGYTTFGYYIAPDTATAEKYIYIAYGQAPWQLWALNITTGATEKLYEVTSAGVIQFADIAGQGWVATIHTALGQPSNVITRWWCLDGALYPYTVGVAPPVAARNVTPASNPLVSPPQIDVSRGTGQLLWRPNGSTGDYALVEYDIENVEDYPIESTLNLSDGTVLGNADQYQGFFRYDPASSATEWYGNWTAGVSRPEVIEVSGLVYICGYPSGSLFRYNPALPWVAGTNPVSLGSFRLLTHVHYPHDLVYSSANNRLYMLGRRERDGEGGGLGYYSIASGTITATAVDLSFGNPSGLVVLPDISRIVASLTPIDGSPGVLVVFDYALVEVARWTLTTTDPGKLYASGDSVIGLSPSADTAYKFNVVTGALVKSVSLGGQVGVSAMDGAEILVEVGTDLKNVNPDTLAVTTAFTGHPGVSRLAPSSGPVLYFSRGAKLYQQSKITGSARSRQRRRRGWWPWGA